MANMFDKRLKTERQIEEPMVLQKHRLHLGASVLGHECPRQIWYGFRWVKDRYITQRLKRLFERGKREEPIIYDDLERIGVRILSTQDQQKFAHGHGGGSHDGILLDLPDSPKTPHILEIKTSNTKTFLKVKEHGVEKAMATHFAQMQIYMRLFKKKRTIYIMVCKENDERHYERIKYQPKVAKNLIKRAEDIITSEVPPPRIKDDPKYYLCRWCDYSDICHNSAKPLQNCRTCKHADLETGGIWRCGKTQKERNYKNQLKGCKNWRILEGL